MYMYSYKIDNQLYMQNFETIDYGVQDAPWSEVYGGFINRTLFNGLWT